MAGPKTYIGVSSKARAVKNIYVGVSSKARKVKKVYVGVSSKARLVYSSDFWTEGGISASNVLACYQFKGASSQTQALKDLSGNGYTLTKSGSPTWTTENGFYFPAGTYLTNASLEDTDIKTVVIRYKDMPYCNLIFRVNNNFAVWFGTPAGVSGITLNGNATTNCLVLTPSTIPNVEGHATGGNYYQTSKALSQTGVVGCTNNTTIYYNGTAQTASKKTPQGTGTGSKTRIAAGDKGYILAVAIYKTALTAAQHKAVSDAMLAL